ncbi:MAG TPA: hypothetical protein VHT72_06340 [Puia sp.]|nr:hypothetical protein [Puia sp.]
MIQKAKTIASRERPLCSKFIIAAIRELRHHKNIRAGASGGASFRIVRNFVLKIYTEQEFKEELKKLIDSGKLVFAGNCTPFEIVGDKQRRQYTRMALAPFVLVDAPSTDEEWFFNPDWELLKERPKAAVRKYQMMNYLKLYLVSDGLPTAIASLMVDEKDPILAKILKAANK